MPEEHIKNLEGLLAALANFELMGKEPNLAFIDNLHKTIFPKQYSKENSKKTLRNFMIAFTTIQNNLQALKKYGNTREEAVLNIKEHIKNCGRCRRNYYSILEGRKRIYDETVELLKRDKNPGYKKFMIKVEELDKRYLSLIE